MVLLAGLLGLALATHPRADDVADRQRELLLLQAGRLRGLPSNPKALAMGAFGCFALAQRDPALVSAVQIARANEFIGRICADLSEDRNTYWILPLLSRIAADPGMSHFLTTETREALKDLLFQACSGWFTVADAATDEATVWHILGSDNHDIMRKQTAFLTAQFLQNHAPWGDTRYQDGCTAALHFEAWKQFFREYFRQRAIRGISVEMASPCYAGVLLYPVLNLRDAAADPVVRTQAEQYLHLYFAEAGLESLNGVRGGAKTRAYKYRHICGFIDKTACYSYVFAGLPAAAPAMPFEAMPALASSHRLPRQIHGLWHDPEARGCFEYVSSRPGRGNHTTEPLWYHVRFPSSIRRCSYVTPGFVLGTFTLDETESYTMLVTQNHWMGLVAGDALDSRIVVTTDAPGKADKNHNDLQAVQRGGTAVFRQNSNIMFKGYLKAFVSPTFTLRDDPSGWLFAENSDSTVYVAMFATDADDVGGRYAVTDATVSDAPGKWVRFVVKRTLLIMEAALAGDYASFDAFRADMIDNACRWVSADELEYRGRHATLTCYRDSRLPRVNGSPVSLNPRRTYDSPFLSDGASPGLVTITGIDGKTIVLDFSYE